MSAASKLFADVVAEWRSNRRLRLGLYVVAAIAWTHAILVMRDHVASAQTAWRATEQRIARARATANSADWTARAQEAKAVQADWESLLWREGSVGLAQAAFQENLNRSLAAAAIVPRSLRLATPEGTMNAELPDIVPMRARLQLEFRTAAVANWLAGLQRERFEKRPSMVVESFTVRNTTGLGGAPIADVEVVAYALRAAPASGKAAP